MKLGWPAILFMLAAAAAQAQPADSPSVKRVLVPSIQSVRKGDTPGMAQTPLRTADFVSSEGVNTHVPYTDGAYAHVPTIIADLRYLGISHVRDGLNSPGQFGGAPLSSYVALAQAGVRFTLMVGGGGNLAATGGTPTNPSLDQRVGYIDQLVQAVPGSVVAVEGTNEINNQPILYDGQGGQGTGAAELEATLAMQRRLYSLVHADPALGGVPVDYFTGYSAGSIPVGPDPATTAGLADADTQHPYPNGGQPPAFWVSRAQALGNESAADAAAGARAVYTETGYSSNGGTAGAVSPDVQAKYTLDLLLDDARQGIAETDLYELLDAYAPGSRQGDAGYGLFDATGAAKPVAVALHNLNAILADTGAQAERFVPAPLSYTLAGQDSTTSSLLLQKSDGTYILAIWDEQPIWNAANGTQIVPIGHQVTLSLAGTGDRAIALHDPMSGEQAVATVTGTTATFTLSDHAVLLSISATDLPSTTPPARPPPTAPGPDGGQFGPGATPAATPIPSPTDAAPMPIASTASAPQAPVASPVPWTTTAPGASSTVTLSDPVDLVTAYGTDTVLAGAGTAVVYAAGPAITVLGGTGALLFVGGVGTASVSGGGGSCTVYAGAGGGVFSAGLGGDSVLVAGAGNTTLLGAAQGDVLFGAAAASGGTMLSGGGGSECVVCGQGATTLSGGAGTTVMFAGDGADNFVMSGMAGAESLVVGFKQGFDTLVVPDALASLRSAQYGTWGTTLALGNGATMVVFGARLGTGDIQSA